MCCVLSFSRMKSKTHNVALESVEDQLSLCVGAGKTVPTWFSWGQRNMGTVCLEINRNYDQSLSIVA